MDDRTNTKAARMLRSAAMALGKLAFEARNQRTVHRVDAVSDEVAERMAAFAAQWPTAPAEAAYISAHAGRVFTPWAHLHPEKRTVLTIYVEVLRTADLAVEAYRRAVFVLDEPPPAAPVPIEDTILAPEPGILDLDPDVKAALALRERLRQQTEAPAPAEPTQPTEPADPPAPVEPPAEPPAA